MKTVPNQELITINKPSYTGNFLTIGIDEWATAAQTLTPSAFLIYLYLCSNSNGFQLALSQVAIENKLGIKKTAYHSAIKLLKEQNYIVQNQFYTSPQKRTNETNCSSPLENQSAKTDNLSEFSDKNCKKFRKNDREINNIYIIDISDPPEDTPDPEGAFREAWFSAD